MSVATCAATRAGGDALTLEKILEVGRKLDEAQAENRRRSMADMAAGLFSPFGGVRVRESPLAVKEAPVRPHKRRRNQSAAYHRRIQKKWVKRYGVKREPCVLVLDGGAYGLGSMFVVPPGMRQALRDAAEVGTGFYRG